MKSDLRETAGLLVVNGRGIFAADASPKTLEKRFGEMGIEVTTVEERMKYRLMTVSTPDLGNYVGGVILHDEAIRVEEVREALVRGKITVGIKVDRGTIDMPNFPGEKITEGLDGLRERFKEYAEMGAKFSKWRAVVEMGDGGGPSRGCMVANASALARYAALSQEVGLVPIVEPEILMDGKHTVEMCFGATETLGRIVFDALDEARIDFSGMLYKPNMVVAGKDCSVQPNVGEVAERTVEVMKRIVPVGVPGVVFLSGGQDAVLATERLNAISQYGVGVSWRWSFSFERAIEGPAMELWKGKEENREMAQKALLRRARANSEASMGKYGGEDK